MGVYDLDREGDTIFMTMELLDGMPLDDYLKKHPEGVSIEDSWSIASDICDALIHAHKLGVLHSDFKPGNIFYTKDKVCKVFDFQIAGAISPDQVEAKIGVGTPTYASYEQLIGRAPSEADDVYAISLIVYELFTGKHPYGRTPADIALSKNLEPGVIPFMKRRHWKALRKGLQIESSKRYQTASELKKGLFSEGLFSNFS